MLPPLNQGWGLQLLHHVLHVRPQAEGIVRGFDGGELGWGPQERLEKVGLRWVGGGCTEDTPSIRRQGPGVGGIACGTDAPPSPSSDQGGSQSMPGSFFEKEFASIGPQSVSALVNQPSRALRLKKKGQSVSDTHSGCSSCW